MQTWDVVLAGAAILDVLVVPADETVFTRASTPVEQIALTTGGDALNEAIVLSRLGKRVRLVTRLGQDMAGTQIREVCRREGIDTSCFREINGLNTGVNVVLVDKNGERRFYTDPHGGLRALEAKDIPADVMDRAKIFCFASIFVFPKIDCVALADIFRRAREKGLLVCADMTLPKRGETVRELSPALSQLDYLFANEAEAHAVTGLEEPDAMANCLLDAGARHVVIKLGARGCLIADQNGMRQEILACPAMCCADTTGAGDTFAAGFLSALLDGRSFADCARMANAAASVSVEAVGASAGVQSAEQVMRRYQASYTEQQA